MFGKSTWVIMPISDEPSSGTDIILYGLSTYHYQNHQHQLMTQQL